MAGVYSCGSNRINIGNTDAIIFMNETLQSLNDCVPLILALPRFVETNCLNVKRVVVKQLW